MKRIGQAQGALGALAALLPDEAERVTDGGTETVPARRAARRRCRPGPPGARVPADGVIVDGAAELDESMITGESRPVAKGVGDRVVAGTVVAGSAIRVRGRGGRRGNRAGRHPASGRRSADLPLARAGPGGSVCRAALLRRRRPPAC